MSGRGQVCSPIPTNERAEVCSCCRVGHRLRGLVNSFTVGSGHLLNWHRFYSNVDCSTRIADPGWREEKARQLKIQRQSRVDELFGCLHVPKCTISSLTGDLFSLPTGDSYRMHHPYMFVTRRSYRMAHAWRAKIQRIRGLPETVIFSMPPRLLGSHTSSTTWGQPSTSLLEHLDREVVQEQASFSQHIDFSVVLDCGVMMWTRNMHSVFRTISTTTCYSSFFSIQRRVHFLARIRIPSKVPGKISKRRNAKLPSLELGSPDRDFFVHVP